MYEHTFIVLQTKNLKVYNKNENICKIQIKLVVKVKDHPKTSVELEMLEKELKMFIEIFTMKSS